MSQVTIQLSIQEMVKDFEELNRYDERLGVLFDLQRATDSEINDFFSYMIFLAKKYIPNFEKHVNEKYFSDSSSKYDKALMLYEMLYENFKEIFYKLV
jgi:hypothetical protein